MILLFNTAISVEFIASMPNPTDDNESKTVTLMVVQWLLMLAPPNRIARQKMRPYVMLAINTAPETNQVA